ncbi:ABC transporter permease [Fusibacter ferrireducens]|uniref:ABC transporter permease n=1 Tax=Fusibacter ferrireducens TaxID=2785058 RepID=A0ABR9ZNS6_9FIRM|nr:ABC transporter permease [Fusibacter ferrireducens]MBF4692123.1 ABC transporter permease [Fusibacter ferrireducens]
MDNHRSKHKSIRTEKETSRQHRNELWYRFKKNKGAMLGLFIIVFLVLVALSADFLLDYKTDVIGQNLKERLQSPSLTHLFGTDELGRDLFFRVIYGARFSISIGVISVSIGLITGTFFGAIAGYFGGYIEEVIMRITDIMSAIPSILLAIAIVTALGASTLNLMIAVGVASIPEFVRITRASVLMVRNQEFIEAARALGVKEWKIIISHVLPNALAPIIVQTTLTTGSSIISASGLSFLGLGVPAPAPEWGSLLSAGRKFIRGYAYLTLFPGMAIMFTVLAFNLMGDGLRDVLDPKLKQ